MMRTPDSFSPAHVAPATIAGASLAFAFAASKLLVCGDENVPAVPRGALPRAAR